MKRLIDEFRCGWRGDAQPSLALGVGFAIICLALATAVRWGLSQLRPDVFFTPYFPAVFFAGAFGGFRIGILTALASGLLGLALNFGSTVTDPMRIALLLMFWAVCGLTIWGVEHYRSIVAEQQRIAKRLIGEQDYRKLVVDELQHRLKNKSSTIHAVLHQALQDQPQIWSRIDHRIRALSATDDLIAKVDGNGCDIKDLLISELGPARQAGGEPCFDLS
jgi:HWE histidine kinase